MAQPFLVAPSLLAADFSRLREEIQAVEKAGADEIHIDVMDGHFVPDLTLGPPVVKKIRPVTTLPFDVHLMVRKPENFITPFARAGANRLTFHIESVSDPLKVIRQIKSLNVKAGLTLRPSTPVEALLPFLKSVDLILVMTVEPGKGGQAFLTKQTEKIKILKNSADKLTRPPLIAVDGGITPETAKQAGSADMLISGSYIFNSPSYIEAVSRLKHAK